jgi:hypothetical protein
LREFLASALLRRRVKIYVYSERVFTTETQNSLRVYLQDQRVAPEYRVVSFDSVTFLQPNPVDRGSGLGSNFFDSTFCLTAVRFLMETARGHCSLVIVFVTRVRRYAFNGKIGPVSARVLRIRLLSHIIFPGGMVHKNLFHDDNSRDRSPVV